MSLIRTRITEFLDVQGVAYQVLPHSKAVFTVDEAAAQRGVSREEMVKSILLRESKRRRYVMACVTGAARLNPQAVRQALPGEWKRLSFASRTEIEAETGYVPGAVSPLCLPAAIPVVFDHSISHCAKVNISSGDPMAGLELDTADLIRLAKGLLGSIAEK